jgi:hypothetical protein
MTEEFKVGCIRELGLKKYIYNGNEWVRIYQSVKEQMLEEVLNKLCDIEGKVFGG